RQIASAQDVLARNTARNTAVIAQQTRAFATLGHTAEEASRGISHMQREVFSLSREMGQLEISGLGVARAFREFPKVAIPVAVVTAAAVAAETLADAAARSVQNLENLKQATAVPKENIVAMERTFRDFNVDAKNVEPTLRRLSETFNKARLGTAAGIEAMISGAQILRPGQIGPTGGGGGAQQPGSPLSEIRGTPLRRRAR